jgi:hypothetical protein
MRFYRSKIILLTSVLVVGFLGTPANAITFGKEEVEASIKFPWAVQIYYFEKNATSPSGLCTGTLIKPDVVLTAAHCVPSDGTFQVKYGATTLEQGGTTYVVDGAWRNPRYSQSKFGVNDVGLLKLKTQVPGAVTLPLASANKLKLAEKSNLLNVYGWGEDQNGELSTYLRSATITNQSAFLSKLIGKNFNSNTWIAAGKYNKTEKVYAGGCRGDSGGPLVATYKGNLFQVGITSFGAENCETAVPTIFMKVSYFVTELNAAVEQLYTNSVVTDRSPPENLIPPSITGAIKVGSIITCQPGQWSKNVSTLNFSWSTPNGLINRTGPNLQIDSTMTGLELKCTVIGSSRAGELQSSVQITVPSRPVINAAVSISGLPKNGYEVAAVNNLICNGANTSGLVDSSTFYWLVRNSSYDTSGTNIGNSSSLSLPSSFFEQNNSKDLVCVNVINGPGGEVRSQAHGTSYGPQKASVSSVQVTGVEGYNIPSEWIGLTASCKAVSNLPLGTPENFQYSWRVYESSSPYYPTDSTPSRTIASGQNLVLTEAILKDAVLKFIGCAATISTVAGSSTGYSTRFYVDYRNIAVADLTAPTAKLISINPSSIIKLGSSVQFVIEVSDNVGVSSYPISGTKLISPSNTEISSGGFLPSRDSGDARKGLYTITKSIPASANGGIAGTYKLLIFLVDAKSNTSGWIEIASFNVN